MNESRLTEERMCFSRVLLGCLAVGFVVGLWLGLSNERFRALSPCHAAAKAKGKQQGRGHAYGREIAELVKQAHKKGQNKQTFLAELKSKGLKVNKQPDREGIKARNKRKSEQRAVQKQSVDKQILKKVGKDLLGRDKIKSAPAEIKNALKKAHGLE